ncbi:MAG TPA: DUF2173 family protein [Gammaproteobacteria bacterium]|nr:DUF2173 family protein [Gammaproteobacteria bacterium]
MHLVSRLCAIPGVVAAGEYAYHGDQFTYEGNLDQEQAQNASIMCRATTMAVHMQAEMIDLAAAGDLRASPVNAWMVRGPEFTVCVVAHVFCFVENASTALNTVMALMREQLAGEPDELIY